MKPTMHETLRMLRWSVLICALLDLALIGTMLSPWAPSRAAAEARLLAHTRSYQQLQTHVRQLQTLARRLRVSQKQAAELTTTAIPEQRTADSRIVRELNQLAEHSGVSLTGISIAPSRKVHAGLLRLKISMRLSGNYAAAVRFLNEVERAKTFYLIDRVAVSGRHSQNQSGVRLTVRLSSFARHVVAPQPATTGAAS